jgi:hypothetical protein
MGFVGAIALTIWFAASLAGFASPTLALSASCGQVTLSNGGVAPSSGTPTTVFTFTVTYTNNNGGTPSRAWVEFQDLSRVPLSSGGGSTKPPGVVYRGTVTKPLGTWTYRFRFRTNGHWCETATETIIVSPPATPTPKPTPTPTPRPTPLPTPTPTPAPTSTPKPTPTPTPIAQATPLPTSTAKSAPTAKPTGKATAKPTGKSTARPTATARGGGPSSPSATATPVPTMTASPTPAAGIAGPIDRGAGGGSGRGWTLDLPGAVGGMTTNPLVVWAITTAGGLLLFVVFLRRGRADDDPWADDVLLASVLGGPAPAGAARAAEAVVGHPADQTTAVLAPPRARTFDKPPAKGVERARIGYRRVRISSKPDAVRSVELGRLDRGDEVEIVDSYEGYLQIRTTDDICGWILRHTIVGGPTD